MEKSNEQWSRRKFISTLTGTGALLLMNPSSLWAADEDDANSRIAALVAKTIGIDTHNHMDVPVKTAQLPIPTSDLSREMKKSGLSAICMTFAVDYQKLSYPGEAYDRFTNGLNAMDVLLKNNTIERSLSIADLRAAHKNSKPTVIQSIEGTHFLEGHLDRLAVAYDRGLRRLALLHDNNASMAFGDIDTIPPQWGGLTAFGAEVIKECNRLGILVDLSHANNETIDEALKVTTRPMIISHTGLDTQLGQNEFISKMIRPRLISKQQAKIVADAGGVIGVWTKLADTPLQYAQNIRSLVDVVGVEHVCIGTDTKMSPSYQAPMSSYQAGSSSANDHLHDATKQNDNSKKSLRVGERTNEAWKYQKEGFYYVVVDALLKTGFTEHEINLIGGENFCKVFDAATKKH